MIRKHLPPKWRVSHWLLILTMLLTSFLSATGIQAAPLASSVAAPAAESAATTLLLAPTDDARTQPGSPNTNFDDGFLWMGHPNVHFSLLKFDLSVLPVDATITGADLRLYFTGMYTGTNQIEVGRVAGAWEEETLTGSTPVSYTWSSQFQTVTSTGRGDGSYVTWNVAPLVQAWHNGALANEGLALRGNGGDLKAAHSKETGEANDYGPKLLISYTLPADDGQPRPDLGDAPDSTNHHGINNTAYPSGILGQFPTVYNVPANQPAGPIHVNQTMEGWLGDFLSREGEADQGPDQDAPRNNILRNTVTGNVADVADNDRADDGWRNRTLRFFDCERTQLDVRISKAPNATRNRMYLNVWFDGNRDGDWGDLGQCQADEEQPAQASYEWIVQDYIIDMTAIPAGGSLDFNVLTEKVLNSSGVGRHWMRFSLSEAPAVRPFNGTDLPDGRGPHPDHPTLKTFQHGETEDVMQRSAPVTTPGTLEIQKRVITDGEPVEWIDYVTYEIRLRQNGGTQPLQARLRDVLPYPLIVYPTINGGAIEYIVVDSPTGGAAPLQAQLDVIPPDGVTPPQQVINWQGALAPNAEIKFTFQVRVIALCQPNQQTMTFTNRVQAQPKGGTPITAEDTFTAKCIGYDESNIEFEEEPILDEIDLDDLTHYPWHGTIRNLHPVSVTLGVYQQPITGTLAEPTLLDQINLGPNETKPIDIVLRMQEESSDLAVDDSDPTGTLSFCLLPAADDNCPNEQQYPNLHGHIPFTLTVRPTDLGDAPDSTNHAGAAMAAYPGVPANFPTVFDPATGLPPGPRHNRPRPFHLGQRVSREAEADLGPDQDPLNNIVPAANDPDNDRGDDGTNLALWNLNNCQTTNLPVQVAITPQAVNYFQQLGTPGYLNIWLDSNRNGDWADATQCGQQPAVEHIVIDAPVNVVGLGAGLHIVNVPTGLVPWPASDKPAWVRITLSERPSNKTLTAGALSYGDGRGYPLPFRTGETEDYYYRPLTAGGGPDLNVQMSAHNRKVTAQEPGLQAAAVDKLGNFEIQLFKIDIANSGMVGVQGALLEFQIPEKLRGQQPALLRAPGIPSNNISFNFEKMTMLLPYIEQDNLLTVVLGWYGCITCTLASQVAAADVNAEYTGVATLTVEGDVDTSNNQSSATARGLLSSPIIGAFMDYTDDACMDRILHGPVVTNNSTVELRGKAEPNSIIAILIGLLKVAEVTSDANGNFIYSANLGQGLHRIHAEYANQVGAAAALIKSPRDAASGQATGVMVKVDTSLPFDPMSTCFVDSKARSYALPILGYSFGATQTGSWLRSGETYKVSLNASSGNLNQYFKVTFEDILISSLLDEDGDGTYQGLVIMPDPGVVQAAGVAATGNLGLLVGNGATESSFSSDVTTGADGVISDRGTGQPLANASVAALVAQPDTGSGLFFSAWTQSQSGQVNPQVTGADGKYNYSASGGLYRLDVVRDGYQPYRSGDIAASEEPLNRNIALSPVIVEAATQQIVITENGFQPAVLAAKPGDVIEFVNLDLAEHSAAGSTWDSGILAPGQSYKVKVTTKGAFSYADSTGSLAAGTILVDDSSVTPTANAVYLPLVQR